MPWFDFFWYAENEAHLAEHGVTREEFEAVVMRYKNVGQTKTGSKLVQGQTPAGRFLVCIFQYVDEITILPITAYEPTKENE